MGFIVTLMLLVGGGLLLGARTRIGRLEYRLRLVEEELRRRIAAGQMPLAASQAEGEEPQPSAAAEPEPEPELPEPPPVEHEPLRGAAKIMAASRIAAPAEEPIAVATPDFQSSIWVGKETQDEQAAEPVEQPPIHRITINFEELFGRKLPIWAGGITLAIAGVLIVKYAIDQGIFGRIFTPGVQAVCGLLFGLGLIGGAEWAYRKREKVADPRVSQALSGAGLSTLYAAVLVAANIYQLIAPLTAFIGLAAVTGGALWLSLRHGMPSALLGLAGGLAAPALTVGLDANVPMLSVYLGFTIAGLAGVARIQRWPWLAMLALLGGAGWSLWLIMAGRALETMGALSVGGFVMLMALAIPLAVFTEAAQRLLRAAAAVVGAAQLGLLVALGGFQPLHWGLFALIAAASQFIAWRDRGLAIVPTISLALSFILLLLWTNPQSGWLLTFGLALGAIHAGPLLARLWYDPARLQRAIELAGIGLAAPLIALRHTGIAWGSPDPTVSLSALGGAVLALGGAALGWTNPGRSGDHRLAVLLGAGGALLSATVWFGFAHWQAPLWTMLVALALLVLAPRANDCRIEPLAAGFAALALFQLVYTFAPDRLAELGRLVDRHAGDTDRASLLRWGGLMLGFGLFAWRGQVRAMRLAAYGLAAALGYGLVAQLVPGWVLPIAMAATTAMLLWVLQRREDASAEALVAPFAGAGVALLGVTGADPLDQWLRLVGDGAAPPDWPGLIRWLAVGAMALFCALRTRLGALRVPGEVLAVLLGYGALVQLVPVVLVPLLAPLAFLALAWWSRERPWPLARPAGATLIALCLGWAILPLIGWLNLALLSLGGVPMELNRPELSALALVRRMALPALLIAAAMRTQRTRLPVKVSTTLAGLTGLLALVALHGLYRHAYAALFGTDFAATGLAQRLLWAVLLLGGGWLALHRYPASRHAHNAAAVLAGAAGLHTGWYSLLIHNPLWSEQQVGSLPVLNLLVPLFALLPASMLLLARARSELAPAIARIMQPVLMVMVIGLAWATLRQAFHGTLLVAPGVSDLEDILRSILGIALAIGFLLWGIRGKRHDWRIASLLLMLAAVAKVFLFDASGLEGLLRIASFVALGFSLIGIGWLYSRQLRRDEDKPAGQ